MANAPLILTTAGKLKELPLVTTVGATGSDAAIPTEQAVREALSAHSHAYADITNKPTTFAPSAHSHAVTAYVRYTGNGATGRVLTLSAAIMPTTIFIMRDDAGLNFYWTIPFYAAMYNLTTWLPNTISVTTGQITLTTATGNESGYKFTLLAWGNAS